MNAWRLIAILASSKLVVISAAAVLGLYLTSAFEKLAIEFYAEGVHRQLEAVIAADVWVGNRDDVVSAGQYLAADKALAAALKDLDESALETALASALAGGAIGRNEIRAVAVDIFDKSMARLQTSRQSADLTLPDAIVESVLAREGAEKRRPFVMNWLDGDIPYTTVVVPIGGLKIAGYLALHADPLHALVALDEKLDAHLTLYGPAGKQMLARFDELEFASEAQIFTHSGLVADTDGQTLLSYELSLDASSLLSQLGAVERFAAIALALIALFVGGGVVAILGRYLIRQQDRTAAAEAERLQQAEALAESAESARLLEREHEQARRLAMTDQRRELANRLEHSIGGLCKILNACATAMNESSQGAGSQVAVGGPFKAFTDQGRHNRVEMRLSEGEDEDNSVIIAALREDRSKAGRLSVALMIDRAQLKRTQLWIVQHLAGTARVIRLEDFITPLDPAPPRGGDSGKPPAGDASPAANPPGAKRVPIAGTCSTTTFDFPSWRRMVHCNAMSVRTPLTGNSQLKRYT